MGTNSSVGDINFVQMFVKPYVSCDQLEGSSVMYSAVDKLIVQCLMVFLCFVPRMMLALSIQPGQWSRSLTFWLIRASI